MAEPRLIEDLPDRARGLRKTKTTQRQRFIVRQVIKNRSGTRRAFQIFWRRQTNFHDAFDDLFGQARRVMMRSTRAGKQNGHITRIRLNKAFFPGAHHAFGASHGIC